MKKFIRYASLSITLLVSAVAHAHNLWLLPSETTKAGKGGWVTFDLAASTGIFNFDSGAPKIGAIQVVAPDASMSDVPNLSEGKLRTTFDVEIKQAGTYKIFVASSGLNARWETADGKRGFWPPRGVKVDPAEFATAVPADAKNLEVSQTSRRVETFVTLGAPTQTALKPTHQGLEMVPITHPNDLVTSERSEFIFLIDGKPAAGAKIEVIEGSSRYRTALNAQTYEADKEGRVKIQWKNVGIYWLGADYKDDKATKPATIRSGSYSATLEVLSE